MYQTKSERQCGRLLLGSLAAALVLFSVEKALGSTAGGSKDRYTVCSLTINSSNERDTFIRNLPKKQFDFIELVPPAKDLDREQRRSWFDSACKTMRKSRKSCDVLLISGHFGGMFFGSSQLDLPLEDLEEHSCNNDCTEILQSPKEIYLFGCNTLAGTEKDSRTPAEYLRVLLADGMPRAMAEAVVAGRYDEVSMGNKARMQRIFRGVPRLYGWKSAAPKGADVEARLDGYLKAEKYYEHLQQLELKSALQDRQVAAKATSLLDNDRLACSIRDPAFTQCSGAQGCDQVFRNTCDLLGSKLPLSRRLQLAEAIIKGPDFLSYLPTLQHFLGRVNKDALSGPELAAWKRIAGSRAGRDALLTYLGHLHSLPVYAAKGVAFCKQLEWCDERTAAREYRKIISSLLKSPSMENRDALCSLPYSERDSFTPKELPDALFRTTHGIAMVSCLPISGASEIQDRIVKVVLGADQKLAAFTLDYFSEGGLKSVSPSMQEKVVEALIHAKEENRFFLLLAAADLIHLSRKGHAALEKASSKMLQANDNAERRRGLKLLERRPAMTLATQQALVAVLRDSSADEHTQREACSILRSISLTDPVLKIELRRIASRLPQHSEAFSICSEALPPPKNQATPQDWKTRLRIKATEFKGRFWRWPN